MFTELFLVVVAIGLADVVVVEGGCDFAFCLVLAFDKLVQEGDQFVGCREFGKSAFFGVVERCWVAVCW